MPALSPSMTEGVLAKWHKKVGDTIKPGEVIAEVETDKATMDLEAYDKGTILQISAPEGSKVAINGRIAIVGEPGEKVDSFSAPAPVASAAPVAKTATSSAPAHAVTTAPVAAVVNLGRGQDLAPRKKSSGIERGGCNSGGGNGVQEGGSFVVMWKGHRRGVGRFRRVFLVESRLPKTGYVRFPRCERPSPDV